jgi:hypothetical protein
MHKLASIQRIKALEPFYAPKRLSYVPSTATFAAGRVRGTIKKTIISEIMFKGYKVHASKEEPQYLIESDKTDHLAMHKGSALRKLKKGKS